MPLNEETNTSTDLLVEEAFRVHRAAREGNQEERDFRLERVERVAGLLKGQTVEPQGSLAARQRDFVARESGRIN